MTEHDELYRRDPVEYPKGTPPLAEAAAAGLAALIDGRWERDGTRLLRRTWTFPDFTDAFGFAARVALVVERAFHHPELTIGWGRVTVGLTTHTVGGLSENDFIVAARLDRLG
jgi:4a-hydroxytetrahydrobiopterin dehydratase